MKYFTVNIETSNAHEYVKVAANNIKVAIDYALKNTKVEGATISDVVYVNSEPVVIVEG